MDYSAQQKGYYLREINRAIPTAVNPRTIDPKILKQALGTEDPATMLPPDVRSLMTEFSGSSNAVKADATCRSLPYPSPAMRDPAARTGCGWWYVSDPLTPSIGSYGTWRGPMNPTLDTSVGPGEWVWDPRQAQEIESIKQAARITTCPDIAYAQMPNIGWCNTTGMAIMTDGAGNPMYPRVAGGDCDPSQIVTNAANCPPPPPPSGGGAGAGTAGGYSGNIPSITSACTPNAAGALSPYCLQVIASQQCASKGLLMSSLNGAYAGTNPQFNQMNTILQQRGFTINSGIVNDGKIALNDAISSVGMIAGLAARNDGSIESNIGITLCNNSDYYDPCAVMVSSTRGPWDAYTTCITNAAAAKGYSMMGAIIPGRIDISYWNSLPTWGDVLARLDERIASAHATPTATDPVQLAQQAQFQANAMNDVYGINVLYPPPMCPPPPPP